MLTKETLDHNPKEVTINVLPDGTAWVYLRKNIKEIEHTESDESFGGFECDMAMCKINSETAKLETEETITDDFDTWWEYACMYDMGIKNKNDSIEFGTYVGTGTFSKENPNTLTFKSIPNTLIISKGNDVVMQITNLDRNTFKSNIYTIGNSVYWYFDNATTQCNEANVEYTYTKF